MSFAHWFYRFDVIAGGLSVAAVALPVGVASAETAGTPALHGTEVRGAL